MVTNRDLEMPSERCIRSLSPSAEHSSFFRRTARRRFFDKTLPNKRALFQRPMLMKHLLYSSTNSNRARSNPQKLKTTITSRYASVPLMSVIII
jgi:hypothetical protein